MNSEDPKAPPPPPTDAATNQEIDVSKLSEQELKVFRLFGKLPSKNDLLASKLHERKYFDSGDYALSKAGINSDSSLSPIGLKHPQAEKISRITRNSISSSRGISYNNKSNLEKETTNS